MDKILKDPNGKIWKDSSGNILKERGFSETPIQDGLTFWGNSQIENLTVVDGLVSEAYDIRDTGHSGDKMVQSVVGSRCTLENGALISGVDSSTSLSITLTNPVRTMFLVVDTVNNANNGIYLNTNGGWTGGGITIYYSSGTPVKGVYLNISSKIYTVTEGDFYINNTQYTEAVRETGKMIIHSNDAITTNLTDYMLRITRSGGKVYEWGLYDRVLNEKEVLYNINAMNARYQFF